MKAASDTRLDEIERLAKSIISMTKELKRAMPRKVRVNRLAGNSFGSRLKSARKARKLKQFELARRGAMSPAQLCQIENDNVCPSVVMAKRLADALGCKVAELMGEQE